MAEQEQFFTHMGDVMQQLATVADNLRNLSGVATARGYDQWQDADLTGAGYTRNDLLALLYLADDVSAFLNNGTPTQQDRMPTVQKFRTDL